MRTQPFFPRLATLIAVVGLAACADLPTSSPNAAPGLPNAGEDVALSLDEMANHAAISGDASSAAAYADGALAVRLGAEPTEIAVTVGDQSARYWAVAIGIVERGPDGGELLRRAVVAWTGSPRPTSAFRVMARSDQAAFGRLDDPADPGRATGTYADFERSARFVAIEGSLATSLNSTGPACPNAERDPRFACNLARFDMRLDGLFELVGDATFRLPVFSEAGGIAGVVVHRTDGGRGGRPGVDTSRPQPTRG